MGMGHRLYTGGWKSPELRKQGNEGPLHTELAHHLVEDNTARYGGVQ